MRKISAYSSKMTVADSTRHTFSKSSVNTQSSVEPQGTYRVFMTDSFIKLAIKEMKRAINIRFFQLIKASKAYSKQIKSPDDLVYLKKFMAQQLEDMLVDYVNALKDRTTLQLSTYLKLQTVMPDAIQEAKILSKVLITANRVRQATGSLPPKNQRQLSKSMNDFIVKIINSVTEPKLDRQGVTEPEEEDVNLKILGNEN